MTGGRLHTDRLYKGQKDRISQIRGNDNGGLKMPL